MCSTTLGRWLIEARRDGWPWRLAGVLEVDGRVVLQLVESVLALDQSDGAALGAHHERMCLGSSAAIPDAAQQLSVGDPRGDEEDVVACD